jgi:hypothetical protein
MPQGSEPFIVTVVTEPAHSTTLRDVILGSLGLAGVLLVIGALLGGIIALGLILWNRRHPPEADHLPSVTPLTPPTSQVR